MSSPVNSVRRRDSSVWTIRTIIGSVFLSTLGVGVFAFALPLLAKDHGIGGTWLGAAFSGYFFAKLILAPLTGALSDKIGPRPLLIFSAFFGAFFPLGYFVFPNHLTLYLIQFGLGLVSGIMKPVGMAVIGAESSEKCSGRLFGWYNVFFYMALMSGPLLGGLVYYNRNPAYVIIFLILCMVTSFLILTLFLSKRVTSCRKMRSRPVSGLMQEKTADFIFLLLAIIGRTAGIAIMISFFPVLLSERLPYNSVIFGLLFSIPSILNCVALPITGRLADRFDKIFLTCCGMLISAFCLFFMGKIHCTSGFISAGLILGLGSVISIPASMSMASGIGSNQGKIMGIFHGAANLGFIVGPLLGGAAVKTMGISGAFQVAGILGIASCLPLAIRYAKSVGYLRTHYLNLVSAVSACIIIFFLSIMPFGPGGAGAKEETFRFADLAMANIVRLTMAAPDKDIAEKAADEAFAAIHRLEKDFDHRNAAGSVGRINASAGVRPVFVTKEAFNLIERALEFCEKTNGVFDISIGAITITPNYYFEDPSDDKKSLVNYRLVQLNKKDQTVFLPKKGMAIDLGGLAKGTIIDCATKVLKNHGISAGIVEAGGDFFCFGNKNWRSGIQHPRRNELLGIIVVNGKGVCGSGDYYQFVIHDDGKEQERRHHIIDSEKMRPAGESISVTVLSPTTELADALATTLFIMGPEKGKEFLKNEFPDSSALWVLPDLKIIKTENFPPFLARR